MERIAFIIGDTFLYWNTIVLTLAAAVAVCFFLAFYLNKCGNAVAGFAAVPVSLVLSLVLSRFVHWYSRADSYADFTTAMTDYTSGGYALMGVFFGCALAAVLLRLVFFHRNTLEMLDCMSLAACAGIAVGRLGSFFNSSDRGQIIEGMENLPWVYPVTNAVSGAVEYRLATFVLQALVALALLVILSVFYLRGNSKGKLKDGDTCLIFILCYGASQVVLDSTRYDSLFFRSNGFVSIVQVFSAIMLGVVIAVFSIRMVKARGRKFWQVPIWVILALCIGCAGFMEYYVQRHGNEAAFAYSIMGGCLAVVILLTLVIRILAVSAERKQKISVR